MSERYDIAVIGAGIVGVATALHLLMQGRKVALVERRDAGRETSYGNAGVVGNGYVLPFGFPPWRRIPSIIFDREISARLRYADLPRTLPWIIDFYFQSLPKARRLNGERLRPLIARSISEHRVLMHNTDAEQHLKLGRQVTLYRDAYSFDHGSPERDAATQMGVPFEVLDAAAFREMEPSLKPAFYKVARWTGSGHLNNPGAVVASYAERFAREGGTVLHQDVRGLRQRDDGAWDFTSSQTETTAEQLVLCAGPWSADLLKPLGYKFPLAFKRGYHQHFASIGGAKLSHAITDAEYGYVMGPMEQGIRITSGAEFASLKAPPSPVQLSRILPRARELFPLGAPVDPKPWHGSRPCFADSLPVVGPAPRHKGLWLNFGHGHMGMNIGPSTARLLTEMIGELPTFCDPYPYRAGRFNC